MKQKMKHHIVLALLIVIISVAFAGNSVLADSIVEKFVDPQDGYLDTSNWLLEDRMFLPVPIIITEPAVGYGAGLAMVYFHEFNKPPKAPAENQKKGDGPRSPPSASALFGGGTENGSWFAGGAHQGSYKNDSLRYQGSLFHPSINLKYYGGGDTPISDQGLKYNLDGWVTIHEMLFRIGDHPFLVGPKLSYFGATSTFETPESVPDADQVEIMTDDLGFGITTIFDTRDNLFSPLDGWIIEFSALRHAGMSSAQYNYSYYDFHPRSYWNLNKTWGVGWRFQGEYASGQVPYWALPDITLRGIPALRYQGNATVVTEAQVDWKLNHRWTIVAFTGVGTTADEINNLSNNDNYWAGGLGFRYLIARVLGLQTGIDVAIGPEQAAIYITMGNAWNY